MRPITFAGARADMMMQTNLLRAIVLASIFLYGCASHRPIIGTQTSEKSPNNTNQKVMSINVDRDVNVEVIDFGGEGRGFILLTGLNDTAHRFSQFAEKLAKTFHVYGVTRRGFGASSSPDPTAENYAADRLGDDVLAVIDSLHLEKPIVAGHSIAGSELSSIGTRHAEKVAGLVYLDALGPAAFYDEENPDTWMELLEAKRSIERLLQLLQQGGPDVLPTGIALQKVLRTVDKMLTSDIAFWEKIPKDIVEADAARPPMNPIYVALFNGRQKYTTIKSPVLAICAIPTEIDEIHREIRKNQLRKFAAFEKANPHAKVVRIENADHYIYESNEADVVREINSFANQLK